MSDTAATWRGAVPLAITAGSSVFYFLSGRLRQDMTVADSDVWFDAEGTALRWQYPVGLLFDLHTARARARDELVPVPWAITAHFGSWPSDRLIPVDADGAGPNTPRSYFMSMIKEVRFCLPLLARVRPTRAHDAMCQRRRTFCARDRPRRSCRFRYKIRQGSGTASLQVRVNLWVSVAQMQCMLTRVGVYRADDHDGFWQVNVGLVSEIQRSVPVRLYLAGHESGDGLFTVLQDLVPPLSGSTPESDAAQATTVADLLQAHASSMRSPVALLHGIVLPPDTPIVWLALNAAYPDGFLHIVVAQASDASQ
nr:autophagy protein 5 [Polyrhizophydium stewartii]